MAARPRPIVFAALVTALTVWVWTLAGVLFVLRWESVTHPGPPIKELFPYGELRIGVDANYPPFAVATANDIFGLDIDLGKTLAERLAIPVRFVNMGYDGLYDAIKTDQVDLLISELLIDPARMGDVLYTVPYLNAGLTLVTAKGSSIHSMTDMSGHSLAYEFGSDADQTAHRWLRRIPPFSTQPYELPDYALDAARLKVADAALVDAVNAKLYLKKHPTWEAVYTYVTDTLYAMAVRIDRGKTWEAINLTLQGMIADGTVTKIIARWL
jgi:ABC-type amino acid transport substrate-binding protein